MDKDVTRRGFLASAAASALTLTLDPLDLLAASRNQDAEVLLSFGSCNEQWQGQGYWDAIGALKPDLWVWLGDIIYSDYMINPIRKLNYDLVKYNSHYRSFAASVPIVGTWDDHDYGLNDSGKDMPLKHGSQRLLLDFLDLPDSHPLRDQEGVYHSHSFEKRGHRIKLILLDLRYFREAPAPHAGLLGDRQWQWLEDQIDGASSSELILIGSSVQCVAQADDGDGWDMYPAERERFLRLLASTPVPSVILSGDRHLAELSRVKLPGARSGQKWIYDLTASGLTHHDPAAEQQNRVGPALADRNFGTLRIRFRKGQAKPEVTCEIRNIDGSVFYSHLVD